MVTHGYSYNNKPGLFPSQSLKTTLDTKTGKRSDINLLLLAYLRANGIEAFPILISTKGNGRSHLVHAPFADQFNQLIIVINNGEKLIYADATDKSRPLGYLSLPFLVDEAFLLDDGASSIIQMEVPHFSGFYQYVTVKWDEAGYFHKESTFRFTDYDALALGSVDTEAEKADLRKKIIKVDDSDVISFKSDIFNKSNRLTHESALSTKFLASETQTLHIQPFSVTRWSENPFTADTRNFPVDFNYPVTDRFSFRMDLPEGYELDDYPENINLTIPNGALIFSYGVNAMGSTIQVNVVLQIKTEYIEAEHYGHLKYFMDVVTGKLKEPIIIRKKDFQATIEN